MYENPNVTDEAVTIVVRFATDAEHDLEMREEIKRTVAAALEPLGHEIEVADSDALDLEVVPERTAEVRQVAGAYVGRDWEVVDEHGRRIWPPPERARRYRAPHMRRGIVLGCEHQEAAGFVAGFEAATCHA